MNKHRTEERRPPEQRGKDAAHAKTAHGDDPSLARRNDESVRKPSRIEPREWRGSGVCGER
ncbi:MAG TPA: hypothetical protein VF502_12845, partial [Stellaceae bacterium]